ncbi:Protein pns1 [Neolecta irregularis DAH-3]|uniref:Protein PNS1 n=1 Tax=Neolecta irregularis (strain DAH-3) TaxID=1198029 RepID=A0A1U7LQQ1_NEOID|nr:Protein pns1 [Neolecta irregularis DAH-3]|eukprot:OLL24959.1 Protein pns1 [Neolecta irregularis DAH-3]
MTSYQSQAGYYQPMRDSESYTPYQPPEYSQKPQEGDQTFEQKFEVRPVYNDVWAAIAFLLDLLIFAGLSGFCINAYRNTKGFQDKGIYGHSSNDFSINTNTTILFAFVLVVAFGLALLYLVLARMFTKMFIWATGIFHVLLGLSFAGYYFATRSYGAAIVLGIFAIFYGIAFVTWIPRIPFATQILQFTLDVSRFYKSMSFTAWFAVTLISAYVKFDPETNNPGCKQTGSNCGKGSLIVVLVFLVFSAYWITEVIKNLVHTTICGVYGAYYYGLNSPQGLPRHATLGSFQRASTYSFGSVSFGSLIVSLIQLLRTLASIGEQDAQQQGSTGLMIVFTLFRCLLGFIEGLVQYFNHYAYTQVALYGKKYIQAAKDTWSLIKSKGIDAIINDCLIDNVLTMGTVTIAYICAFLCYLYLKFTKPGYNTDDAFTPVIMAFGFLAGLQIGNTATVTIKSGTATLFVVIAEDPAVLRNSFPLIYERIMQRYPGFSM